MVIRINGEAVDFELEEEKDLGEVVRALQAWAAGQALTITSLTHGAAAGGGPGATEGVEQPLGGPADGWQATPLGEVGTVSLTVAPLPGAQGDVSASGQPAADGPHRQAPSAAHGAPGGAGAVPSSELPATSSLQGLQACAASLEEVEQRLVEVPLLLQTGRDRQAMEAVILLSDRLRELIRALTALRLAGRLDPAATIAGEGLLTFTGGLNDVLRELQTSFENRDSVLIGDLLEYEVAPRLAGLRAFARVLS